MLNPKTMLLAILPLIAATARSEEHPATPAPATVSGSDAWIRSILLTTLPRTYENTRHWGKTKPRWDGLHISLDGLRVKTKRRWKNVNHGTWTRYEATLIDPERHLVIRSDQLRPIPDRRVAFQLTVDAKLLVTGRLAEWQQGVQLYSFSAAADAFVRLHLECELGLDWDSARFPPDVTVVPHVRSARLELRDFDLHAISAADGPLVRELGESLHDVLQGEIDDRQPQLVARINRTLDKHSGKLRLSVEQLVTNHWGKFLGERIESAAETTVPQ